MCLLHIAISYLTSKFVTLLNSQHPKQLPPPPQVDRLEDELYSEQEKYKAIVEELELTFAEMSGY